MPRVSTLVLVPFALSLLGGTCSKPPPYHDVSGTWAVESWGPSATMKESSGAVDFDVAMSVKAPVPVKRGPVPVTGTVCVRDPKFGMSGTYTIHASASVYEGSDYGGARLDLVAKAADGRRIKIVQAFMDNPSPDTLGNSLIFVSDAKEEKKLSFRFIAFKRRNDVACP